ncbi:hypothetical protein RRF57_002572 [Xylaria bambusicola]|uniref:Rhodopsin domain-containing protein n=1 Tax=Xylaria bambusicola TaxID=326684 RepID=A0AAN7Z2L3_9PEZI
MLYWDPKPDGWCRDTIIFDIATVAANFFLDLAVLALPLPVLWSLKMSIRDKLTVTAMFSIGTIALISWRSSVTVKTRGSPDWTASLCKVGEIAMLELYLGIIAVCIPTLGPLFNAHLKPIFSRLGLTTMGVPKSGPNNLYPRTWGSSGTRRRAQKYSELNESADRIVSRNNSIRLGTTERAKSFRSAHSSRNMRCWCRVIAKTESTFKGILSRSIILKRLNTSNKIRSPDYAKMTGGGFGQVECFGRGGV